MTIGLPLPYSSGSIGVIQGFNTTFSHSSYLRWGVDFDIDYGSMTHALLGGEIVAFRQNVAPTYMQEGQTSAGQGHGNYLTIKSLVDGVDLYTTYAHLEQNFLLETLAIAEGEGALGSYGFLAMGGDIGRVGATGVRATSLTTPQLRADPESPDSGVLVDHRGSHLHVHFGTDIIRFVTDNEWVANGLNDATLPVYYASFGLNPDGSPTNPALVAWPGTEYRNYIDANYDDFSSDIGTRGQLEIGLIDRDQVWGTLEGRPEGQSDTDWFAVDLEAGVTYAFALRGADTAYVTQGLPTLANPTLRIRDAAGNQITWDSQPWETGQQTAEDGAGGRDVRVSFTAPETGTYYLVAYSSTAETGTYRLSGVRSTPWPEREGVVVTDGIVREGDEFVVNTTTISEQASPQIVELSDGRLLFVWSDFSQSGGDTSESAIRAQIYNLDGSMSGEEFLVNTSTRYDQAGPTVAALNGGGFAISWSDSSQVDYGSLDLIANRVSAQFYNSDGSRQGEEFSVSAVLGSGQYTPEMEALEDGRIILTWVDSNHGIRARFFDSDGSFAGAEFQVNSSSLGYVYEQDIAAFADGRFLVVWQTSAPGVDSEIRGQMFNSDGSASGAELFTEMTNGRSEPVVTEIGDGRFVLCWRDMYGEGDISGAAIMAQIFNSNGTTSGPEILVNTTTRDHQNQPTIDALGDGRFVVTWTDYSGIPGPGADIRAQAFGPDGVRLGEEFVVNATTQNTQYEPYIQALAAGRFVVAWRDHSETGSDTSGSSIRAQIFDTGTSGTPPTARPAPVVSAISGQDVTVTRREANGDVVEVDLANGDTLRTGDRITTGADTTARFEFSGGAVTTVQPNSVLDFCYYDEDVQIMMWEGDLIFSREDSNPDRGNIWNRVIRPLFTSDNFIIETPNISIGVRGTALNLSYRIDAATGLSTTSVDLFEGALDVLETESGTVTSLNTAGDRFAHVAEASILVPPPINTASTGTVLVTGVATKRGTLGSDVSGLADSDGLGSFRYQWLADGVEIAGATGTRLTLTDDLVGRGISLRLSYNDGNGYFEQVTSAVTAGFEDRDILGTDGADSLTGTAADDYITAGVGNDRLDGAGGRDTLYGGDDTDTLIGGAGDDFLFGGATEADLRDVIFGGDGNDSIDGGWGNDDLNGGNGNDTIIGGFGSDTVIGNDGNDVLAGSGGSDLMFGNAGSDTLNGGFGFDRLNGGAGADSFFHAGVADHGSDWIQDYNAAEGDVLTVGLAGATRAQFQVNTTFTTGAGSAEVQEAFVIYRPTGQILWALVDGASQSSINLQIGGQVFDLLA